MTNHSFFPANILLPKEDFERWAVIACDQFTSEGAYWAQTEKTVGDAPSTLRITLPEIYLEDGDVDKRIEKINRTMDEYLASGVLAEHRDAMIYVERTQQDGRIRHGIVGCIRLDDYDYRPGAKTKIRATEQTVVERIPPRVRIRKDASLELPHVMLLMDDPMRSVVEPLAAVKDSLPKAYDFELMQGGGHITGYSLTPALQAQVQAALDALIAGLSEEEQLLFAVGDGNHSLATAKECYRLCGSEEASKALVEIVNIHDDAIEFEPIYRLLIGGDGEGMLKEFLAACGGDGYTGKDAHKYTVLAGGKERTVSVRPTAALPVGTLQSFLDGYLKTHPEMKIDYIHGVDSMKELCAQDGRIGFLFDGMTKEQLFPAVKADGALPRKTFSMGHARDKRYYIEARALKK